MSDPTQWIYTNTDYPQIKPGDNVRVYRNLHRKCWSVQARVDGKWRVVGWADRIIIRHGKFRTRRRVQTACDASVARTYTLGARVCGRILGLKG